jgi:hypothetical protein
VTRTPALSKRLAASLIGALIVIGAGASTGAAGPGPQGRVTTQATQGQLVNLTVTVSKPGAHCSVQVRYADGALQRGLKPASAANGRVVWKWRVPQTAAPGSAKAIVSCVSAGKLERDFLVVAKPRSAPKLTIVKQGYTLRYKVTGGSTASFGVVLRNTSSGEDAVNVNVLINFVDPANVVVGSVSKTLSVVTAGMTYNYGGSLDWQGYPTVSRIETVVTVSAHAPTTRRFPGLANVGIVGSPYDPGYVGEVDGELRNEDKRMTLRNANLSIVVLDAAGNVIGGGTGMSFAPVPPGARILFKAQNGFSALKLEQAASALVSVEPSWAMGS